MKGWKNGMRGVGVVLLVMGSVTGAFAAESREGMLEGSPGEVSQTTEVPDAPDARDDRRGDRRARIARKIQAVHAAHVASALELSAEESAVVLPVLRDIQKKRHEAHRATRKAHEALSTAFRAGEGDVEPLRAALVSAREKDRQGEKSLVVGLCAVLSPRKCALFTLEAPRLEREVRRAMRDLRKGGKGERPGRGMRGPRGQREGKGRRGGPPHHSGGGEDWAPPSGDSGGGLFEDSRRP